MGSEVAEIPIAQEGWLKTRSRAFPPLWVGENLLSQREGIDKREETRSLKLVR